MTHLAARQPFLNLTKLCIFIVSDFLFEAKSSSFTVFLSWNTERFYNGFISLLQYLSFAQIKEVGLLLIRI